MREIVMESTHITLCEIAFASYLYTHTSDYDKTLKELRENTKNSIDLENSDHRQFLLEWLNSWGCRQFALKYHQHASIEILTWYQKYYNDIIPQHKTLLEIDTSDMDKIMNLFNSLSSAVASLRNDQKEVHFGQTGASKILFALRPLALPPWDDPIRENLKIRDNVQTYCEYIKHIKLLQQNLCKECERYGLSVQEFFKKIGKPETTWMKLIDEYYWMRYTRGIESPKEDDIQFWYQLSREK